MTTPREQQQEDDDLIDRFTESSAKRAERVAARVLTREQVVTLRKVLGKAATMFEAITTVDGDSVVTKHATFKAALNELQDDLYVQPFLSDDTVARLRRGERVAIGDEGMAVEIKRCAKPGPARRQS